MSQYYHSQRVKGLYAPAAVEPFRLSRSKIDLFIECPRCFYFDRRLGVGRPPGFPYTLNSAVDALLKKEFDIHRAKNTRHPLMEKYGVEAVPIPHEMLDVWRENFKGIQYLHKPTNFLITGAIDDLWARLRPPQADYAGQARPLKKGKEKTKNGVLPFDKVEKSELEYIVVDYKATAKLEEITALDQEWHKGYKRQMEVYQWLLRQNGYQVSDTGYFVYCNGRADKKAFDGKLEFDLTLIAHKGNESWIEKTLMAAHQCLNSDKIPEAGRDCDYCSYVHAVKGKE